jgi:subtilisin family serine protease
MENKKVMFVAALLVFQPVTMLIQINLQDLGVSEEELVGKPTWWDNLLSGQAWQNLMYGEGKVGVEVFNLNLAPSKLSANEQEVNIKLKSNSLDEFEEDYNAEYEILYEDEGWTYVTAVMPLDSIAQKFWSRLFNQKEILAEESWVDSITLNSKVEMIRPMNGYAKPDEVSRTTYDLCQSYGILDEDVNGTNVSVAILDTGIATDHEGLEGVEVHAYSTVVGEKDPEDKNGHGTHCAGILAGANITVNDEYYRGVAPGINLTSIKVLGSKGSGTEKDIIKGIYNATELGVDIISMSLGGTMNYWSATHDAINYAIGKGVIVVAAAGNSANIVSCQPASWEGVISVEALQENKKIAPYTCLGGDIMAEGTNITSLNYKGGVTTKSGTSMACPFVAGVIALLLEKEPSLRGKPAKVENYLKKTGQFAPEEPKQVKIFYFIPATSDSYSYNTKEIDPDNLLELNQNDDKTRDVISDVRTQILRRNGV